MDNDLIYKCEITLNKIFYPKNVNKVESGEFAIFVSKVIKDIENCEDMFTIKLKGKTCGLKYRENYKVVARLLDTNETYGNTYEILFMSKKIDMSSKEKQKDFLCSIIHENYVHKLFQMYDNVMQLLEDRDIESLIKIEGIGKSTALRIIKEYEDSKDYSPIYTELGKIGLTPNMIKKLVEYYQSPDTVVDKIKNDPYDLVNINGIGFKKADEIALKTGVGFNDYRRVKGFIIHTLMEQGEMGKSYLMYSELMNLIYLILGNVEQETISLTAQKLIENKEIVIFDDGNIIALTKYYKLEKRIYEQLIRIRDAESNFIYDDFNEVIQMVEEEQGFEYTEEQKETIRLGLDNNVLAITGGGGAGKSSTAKGIVAFHKDKYEIKQCALSGKASVRITEATGFEANTIHKTLEWSQGTFRYNEENPLKCDLFLLDEATMVNGNLFLSILRAIPNGCKLIMMGDVQQLTPIGNCQVYADILESEALTISKLTKLHRQALKSGIIPTSLSIAQQEQIFKSNFEGNIILGELQDMELDIIKESNSTLLSQKVIEHFLKHYQKNRNIMEIQIAVTMRTRGELSCWALNTKIQELINPKDSECCEEIIVNIGKKGENKFYYIRVGDKVINVKNNYNTVNEEGDTIPIFNGNMGIVKEISKGYCVVDFEGIGEIILDNEESRNLELSYACTVHKCLTEDTWLFTNEGLKQLKELNNGAKEHELKPLSDDTMVYNGKELERPSAFYNAGKSDCKKIITKRNYCLTGTLDHKIDYIGEDGYIYTKQIKDVVRNDCVLISKNNNIFGNKVDLPTEWNDSLTLDIRTKVYNVPKKIDVNFARFLGYMVADGVICESGLKLAKRHKEVVLDFQKVVKEIFGYYNDYIKHVDGKIGGFHLYEISSKHISKYCKNIRGLQPNNKYVPECILSAPKHIQVEFLKTIFEDGTVNIKKNKNNNTETFDHIEISMKNKLLMEQIRMMLLNLGIISTHWHKEKGDAHFIYIYKKEAIIFLNEIGFISKFKQDRLLKCLETTNYTSERIAIPNITKIINKLCVKYNINLNKGKQANIIKSIKINQITYMTLESFLKYYYDILQNDSDYIYLRHICDNMYVDKVVKIENSIQHTYCIEMPMTHKFIQNGFVGWNCQGSGFNTTIVAIDSSSYVLNNSEMLYTAITRAKKYCVLIGNNNTIRLCIAKRETKIKQTFLKHFLLNEDSEN